MLELLDPYRFTRGVKVDAKKDLPRVMVRRLKDDIREIQGGFPKRQVVREVIDGLPADAPEIVLSDLLDDYRTLREKRFATTTRRTQAAAGLLVVGLQQRLLSSIEAFARSLDVHRNTVRRQWEGSQGCSTDEARAHREAERFTSTIDADDDRAEIPDDELEGGDGPARSGDRR